MTAQAIETTVKSLYDLLDQMPITYVIQNKHIVQGSIKPLIEVKENEPLGKVLELLRKENILAVPVYRVAGDSGLKSYCGIVSVYDLLVGTVFQNMFHGDEDSDDMIVDIDYAKEEFNWYSTPIKDLIGTTFESTDTWILNSKDTIANLLCLFSNGNHHRVLVWDDTTRNVSSNVIILTQTDLISYLWNELKMGVNELLKSSLKTLFRLPVSRASLLHRSKYSQQAFTVTVPSTFNAVSAFRWLHLHKVSALPIVNADRELIGSLSASDVRGLTLSTLETLQYPVFKYLEQKMSVNPYITPDQVKSVLENEMILNALEMIIEYHIHRVWITKDDVPVGVISITDILSLLTPNYKIP
ncbi:hypothetical protein BC833DRAFT_619862 [Globomyces pollinis-pini]|nr:hypothetical protein BC833DRAFT_619862 [Globomyces pollinis-pini]